jgi:hypothetical protein
MKLIDRLKKIKHVEDIEQQIRLAKQHVRRLKTDAKAKSLLEEKLIVQEKVKEAERTLRKLRTLCFDIEDAILAGHYQPDLFCS